MAPLSDDAIVVRGGQNRPDNFSAGSGVTVDVDGKVEGVSVNAGELSLEKLTAPDAKSGYPGIPHNRVGVTTVGKIRSLGGEVVPSPTKKNPNHATLSGLTPEQASSLFRPTMKNPRK